MAGVVIEPVVSVEAIERNLKRLNDALVAMQGGSIAMENIVGYEDLATKVLLDEKVAELEKMRIPVGGRYYSSSETNPADFFGYGTWELVGAGLVEIGVGTLVDSRGEEKVFAAGETGGEISHVLTVEELAKHDHASVKGHRFGKWASDGGSGQSNWSYQSGMPDSNSWEGYRTTETGSGEAHNNLQPYEVIYKWKRTE